MSLEQELSPEAMKLMEISPMKTLGMILVPGFLWSLRKKARKLNVPDLGEWRTDVAEWGKIGLYGLVAYEICKYLS